MTYEMCISYSEGLDIEISVFWILNLTAGPDVIVGCG